MAPLYTSIYFPGSLKSFLWKHFSVFFTLVRFRTTFPPFHAVTGLGDVDGGNTWAGLGGEHILSHEGCVPRSRHTHDAVSTRGGQGGTEPAGAKEGSICYPLKTSLEKAAKNGVWVSACVQTSEGLCQRWVLQQNSNFPPCARDLTRCRGVCVTATWCPPSLLWAHFVSASV